MWRHHRPQSAVDVELQQNLRPLCRHVAVEWTPFEGLPNGTQLSVTSLRSPISRVLSQYVAEGYRDFQLCWHASPGACLQRKRNHSASMVRSFPDFIAHSRKLASRSFASRDAKTGNTSRFAAVMQVLQKPKRRDGHWNGFGRPFIDNYMIRTLISRQPEIISGCGNRINTCHVREAFNLLRTQFSCIIIFEKPVLYSPGCEQSCVSDHK